MYINFKEMKKILLLVFVFTLTAMQKSNAQTTNTLLKNYYSLKDALVSGNGESASSSATELVKSLEDQNAKLPEGKAELAKHAALIAKTMDIKVQREHFAQLSNGFITLAKTSKLSDAPVYVQYCPMKKSSWLSSEKSVKNPYYGSAMLTCGKVAETIN